jgi:signal transduction histidine kinase
MQTSHILIIDDDPGMLVALLEMLRLQLSEVTVNTSNSPREALEWIAAKDYDAIISDIKMPGLNGLALLTEIRNLRPTTPILLMTAHDDHAFVVQALRGGAYDFIQKPIDQDYFVASLQRAIQVRQLSRQVNDQKLALERHAEELEETVKRAVAEAEAAQKQLAFLASASTLLGASLDYEATLSLIVRLALRAGADYAILDTFQEAEGLQGARVAHVDRTKEALVQEMRQHYQNGTAKFYPARRVLDNGKSLLTPRVTQAMLESQAANPEQLSLLQRLNPQTSIIVPLRSAENTLGVLTLARSKSDQPYGSRDLSLIEDLARRAAMALDNARLYEEARQALQVRDHFLSIASHELKTPMTSILGTTQLLLRRFEKEETIDPRVTRNLQILARQTQRLNQLVASLLDISRLEVGQFTIDENPVDIVQIVKRVADETSAALDQHTIEYQCEESPVMVFGDELRLEQVFQNLLQNAIKYSPKGGTVHLKVKRLDRQVQIEVKDEGIGIPAEALPRLFSRFYRVNNPNSQRIPGVGLGLYVVKEIISLHQGTVEVSSAEGQGSTFTILLPLYNGQTPTRLANYELVDHR